MEVVKVEGVGEDEVGRSWRRVDVAVEGLWRV